MKKDVAFDLHVERLVHLWRAIMVKNSNCLEKEKLEQSLEMYKLIFDSIYNGA